MVENQTNEPQALFFISYTSADRIWAEWMRWQLEENGYAATLPESGLHAEKNFIFEADMLFRRGQQIILILSPDYLRSLYSQLEWAILLKQEAANGQLSLFPIVVRECKQALKSLGLEKISALDITELDEDGAKKKLLATLRARSSRPRVLDGDIYSFEDKDLRASLKRQLGLLNLGDDWEISEAQGEARSSLPFHHIPYPHNPLFTGREDILAYLHSTFASNKSGIQPQALVGLGGVGKTQIAIEYTYRHLDRYQYILWTQAASRDELSTDFRLFADRLHLSIAQSPGSNGLIIALKQWLQEHSNWLLVFDNADNLTMVSEFLPVEHKGHILLTTCAQAVGALARCIPIQPMTQEEGAYFLLRRINKLALSASLDLAESEDRALAKKISAVLDGLPLALDQAGAFIQETRSNLSEYLPVYFRQQAMLLRNRGTPMPEHPESVFSTWSLSFEVIARTCPAAVDLLHLCAFLAPDNIPEEILIKGASSLGPVLAPVVTDPFALRSTIEELRKFSFLVRNAERKTLSIHSLVQTVLREGMSQQQRCSWIERAIRAVDAAFPKVEIVTWQQCEPYVPHALACLSFLRNPEYVMDFEEAAHLLHQVAAYLVETAQYSEAEPLYAQAIALYQKLKGLDDLEVATLQNERAWLYRTLDSYEQAEELFKQARTIRELRLGPEHPLTLQTLSDLGWLYYNQGKYAASLALHREAYAIRLRVQGPDHSDTATSLNSMAWLNFVLGNYKDAELLYRQSLSIRQHALSDDHPYLATTFDNLARLYLEQARYADAEEYYKRSLAIRQQTLPPGHPDLAHSRNGLAQVWYIQGKYREAESSLREALAIREKVYGRNHRHVGQTLTHLARLFHTTGRYTEAELDFREALKLRELVLGPDHPDVAQTLMHLAQLYHTLGRYAEAGPLYQRALQIRRRTLEEMHPLVAHILHNLGRLSHAQGRYAEAEIFYIQALRIRQDIVGARHPDTAETLHQLADLYRVQGKYSHARSYAEQARARLKKSLGTTHLSMASMLNTLGEICADLDQDTQAEQYFREAWSIQLDCLGATYPGQAPIINNLAALYCKRKEYDQAEPLLTWIIEHCQTTLGKEHPYLASSLYILAEVLSAQDAYVQAEAYLMEARRICEHKLGETHPELAANLVALADLSCSQTAYAGAEALYLHALAIREQTLGGRHFLVADTLCKLARLYSVQRLYTKAAAIYSRALEMYESNSQHLQPKMSPHMEQYIDLLIAMGEDFQAIEIKRRIQAIRDQEKSMQVHALFQELESDTEGT